MRIEMSTNNINQNQESSSNLPNGINEMLSSKVSKVYSVFNSAMERNLLMSSFLSFNGGKDCTVLLHLIKSYYRIHHDQFKNNENVRIIYIQPENPFKEVEDFVDSCEQTYNVKIEKFRGRLRSVLEDVCGKNKDLKGVIMGSRRSDPYCQNLQTFHPTDPGWPPLIRINPLLDWTTKDIWNYIRCNKITYCSLYDEGYTSLGDRTNTQRNPHLKFINPQNGEEKYRPAYELLDDELERAGRT